MKQFKKLCALLLVTGMASGCVATHRSGMSLDGLSAAHAADARALAEVSADQLAERHAPAQTALALSRADGAFGEAFEKALRLKGFAVVAPDYGGSSLGVSYRLGSLEGSGPAVGYAQISMSDGKIFSVSRMLGSEEESSPTYTEPPAAPVPSRELESRPLPESPAPVNPAPARAETPAPKTAPAADTPATVKRYPVRKTATAAVVARRSGVNVDDFCKWNGVGKLAMLPKGTLVYLSEPPAGTIVAGPDVPVPPKAAEVQQAEHQAKQSVPVVAPTPPTKTQISPALTPPAVPAATAVPSVSTTQPLVATPLPEADLPPISSPSFPWEIQKGVALQKQMEGWATVAGYHLVWESPSDYMMESRAMFHGTYIEAVRNLFAALAANGHALRVTVYEGNKTVVISEH
ncbi:MAG: TcpQ domain-containing protein [Desulfovibrio sp.]|uniref:TcpQ domain-containing protein n=1 Tax=Desulfovibrio sp. TaxID=885 RepID=UPI0025BCBF6A|nr:TcpQ domain-containing protein [Desulfovibrio sp.]MCI7568958.1 TcpQ domain-containing protein [Desulfovibrio sp.]